MHTTSSAATPTGGRIALALAAVYVIWGSTYLGIRFALEGGFPPFLLGGIRFLIAGGLMYAFLRWRGVPAPTRPQWRNASVMGLLLMLFGNGMVNLAEQTVSSGMTAVAVASAPLWIGIFSAIRGDKPGRMEWVGIAIGFLGVLWLNADSSLTASPVGLVALLIASLSWSFGSVWSRGRDLPSPFMSSAAQMLCGGVAMCIVGAAVGERFDGMPSAHGMAAFEAVRTHNFELDFVYPTQDLREMLRVVHRDLSPDDRRRLEQRAQGLSELIQDIETGVIHVEDIDPETMKKLKKLLGGGQ